MDKLIYKWLSYVNGSPFACTVGGGSAPMPVNPGFSTQVISCLVVQKISNQFLTKYGEPFCIIVRKPNLKVDSDAKTLTGMHGVA